MRFETKGVMWTGLGIRPRLGRRDAEEAKEGEAFRGSPTALPADQESSEGARQGHPSLAGCFFFAIWERPLRCDFVTGCTSS